MKKEETAILKQQAREVKLVYSSDSAPGFTRKKSGKHFTFFDTDGRKILDKQEIKRIRSLALPPAWTDVWICPKTNGHLQATGHDAKGRKQYKYHPDWVMHRNKKKHNHMLDFAKALPVLRQKLASDLEQKEFSKDKVVALAISVMDKTYIRVGNEAYTKMYGSFGLTSLRNKHIKIEGNKMVIAFKGKKGVFQEITLTHARLCRMLKKLKDIPGQELFQFYEKDGTKRSIDSGCVNEYLEACTGQDFTAKDFRTWWGTVIAAGFLAHCPPPGSKNECEKNIIASLDHVAKKLGNTRAVCRKYYVHPALLSQYEAGDLKNYLSGPVETASGMTDDTVMSADEIRVMKFIEHVRKSEKV